MISIAKAFAPDGTEVKIDPAESYCLNGNQVLQLMEVLKSNNALKEKVKKLEMDLEERERAIGRQNQTIYKLLRERYEENPKP